MELHDDTTRKGILTAALQWLYEELHEDLPALVRAPMRFALLVALRANPEQRAILKGATRKDTEEVLTQSQLGTEYAAAGMLEAQAIGDAVRHLQLVFDEGVEKFSARFDVIEKDTSTILAELRALYSEFKARGGLDAPFTLTPPRNIPPRNDKFVGRYTELDEIHARLQEEHQIGVTQQTAAHGDGGVGKTAVAQEYAWRHLDHYPGGIFWLGCDVPLMQPGIVDLAGHLGIADLDTPEHTAEAVQRRLAGGPRSLLILDNVRDNEQLVDTKWGKYLPGEHCVRLITTRAEHLTSVSMYPVHRLPRDQGIALLAKYRPDAAAEANEPIVGDVVDFFDGLAVGLTVVGVYMTIHPELAWEAYADSLANHGLGTVRATGKKVGTLPDYKKRVEVVIDETIDALLPERRRTLEYAALMPEDMVVRGWIEELLRDDPDVTVKADPGYEDDPEGAVVEALLTSQLLRPAGRGRGVHPHAAPGPAGAVPGVAGRG